MQIVTIYSLELTQAHKLNVSASFIVYLSKFLDNTKMFNVAG